jgi:sucrose phosphorylase
MFRIGASAVPDDQSGAWSMPENQPASPALPDIDKTQPPMARIQARLAYLYGEHEGGRVARRIQRIIETHKQLRKREVSGPFWTHRDVVLITYGDTIQSPEAPPLQTLHDFLALHLKEAFSMVHVLPFFPWSSDDGFSVTDFRAVNEALGDWQDILRLGQDFDLVMDLVLNHCSRENLWFIDFIAGQEPACDYFIDVDPAENLAMVTRPRSSPLLSGVRTHRGLRHVWTTFSNDQIDLNYANPDVLLEFIDILLYYFRRGARMVRLDAVAYLWKQIGTSCIHLPQTHQVVKLFRDVLELVEPGGLIMTETNVPHAENVTYFGDGDEAQVIYQFSLPPLLLHALYSGNTRYLRDWAMGLEVMALPADCTFLNFTASHDGVGLRPLEGLVPREEAEQMLEAMRERGGYISTKRNSDGTDSPYELNISYFDAFRSANPQDNQWHVPAFLVSQVVALTFKGIPAVYIHCLTATPNDTLGVERTGMTRSINRRKWDRGELEGMIANRHSETGHVFRIYQQLLTLRRQQAALHPDASQHVLGLENGLFGLLRVAPDESQRLLALFNFTDTPRRVPADQLPEDVAQWPELLGLSHCEFDEQGLELPPYAACWFSPQAG